MHANIDVHEPKPPDDPDSPLAFSMEGYPRRSRPPRLIPRFWAPGWNSVQAVNKFQDEVGGPLRGGDPGRRLIEPGGQRRRQRPISPTLPGTVRAARGPVAGRAAATTSSAPRS